MSLNVACCQAIRDLETLGHVMSLTLVKYLELGFFERMAESLHDQELLVFASKEDHHQPKCRGRTLIDKTSLSFFSSHGGMPKRR